MIINHLFKTPKIQAIKIMQIKRAYKIKRMIKKIQNRLKTMNKK